MSQRRVDLSIDSNHLHKFVAAISGAWPRPRARIAGGTLWPTSALAIAVALPIQPDSARVVVQYAVNLRSPRGGKP